MAINKNFVIKNGIEVNDNVFVVDPNENIVGINTALPEHTFHVIGGIGVTDARITGVTTALGDVLVADSTGVDGKAFAVRVSAGNSVGINTANPRYPLEIVGPASIGQVAEYVFGDLEVTGDITSANINAGSANFTGITTFTDTTQNTLGNADTGAVQIDGGLGIAKNVTIGAGLSVTGDSYFVGVVTFAAGASGTIQLGDNANDNVEFQADVNSNIIPNATSTFNLGSDSQEWRDLHLAGNAGIGSLAVSGISTFNADVDINADVDVTGNIGVGSLAVTGISTFVGLSTFNGGIAVLAGVSTFLGAIDANGDLDVDGHTELDNLNVSGVSTFVGVSSFTNTTENTLGDANTGAIKVDGGMGIAGNVTVGGGLSVTGNSYFVGMVTFAAGTDGNITLGDSNDDNVVFVADVNSNIVPNTDNTYDLGSSSQQWKDLYVNGLAELDFVNVSAASTFAGAIDANGDLDVDGHTELDDLNVSGISTLANVIVGGATTFTGAIDANGDLDVDGHTELDDLNVAGVSTFVGIASFTNTTENTLGDVDSGSVKFDGGLGIAGNVTVGGGLSVTGNSYFVGMVTFAAGTNGNITLGDSADDNVVFNADVNSNITPNANNTYDLGSSSQQWRNFFATGNAGIGGLSVAGISTFVGLSTFNDGLIVHAGISTFEERIVGAATSNVIPFYYANISDFPSATTYHGAFAHAHDTGKAYFAHANAWLELVNANTSSVVGTGTEGYNVGVVTATQVDIGTGGLDVDGHTELDGVNVSGATTTNILHVGTAGTVLSVNDETSTFAIGSASNNVTATMNGGAIPSIGLVIALGG